MPESVQSLRADFLRIGDLVDALEINRAQIDRACQEFRVSRGKSGLAHCKLGRGFLFRRTAVEQWIISLESSNHA